MTEFRFTILNRNYLRVMLEKTFNQQVLTEPPPPANVHRPPALAQSRPAGKTVHVRLFHINS